MTDAKEQKQPVLIRLPLPIQDWLFSEAVEVAKVQRVRISVPSLIVSKLTELCDRQQAPENDSMALPESGVEKKSVLVRLPLSVYDRLFSESVDLARVRRVRMTVPSLVVEKLSRLHRQAQEKQSAAS
jgi:rRNA-processing protein FCF1